MEMAKEMENRPQSYPKHALLSTVSTGEPVDCAEREVPSCTLDVSFRTPMLLHSTSLCYLFFWSAETCWITNASQTHLEGRRVILTPCSRHTVCHDAEGLVVGPALDDGGQLLAHTWGVRKQRHGIFFPFFALCQVPQSVTWSCSHIWVGLFPSIFLCGGAFLDTGAGILTVCHISSLPRGVFNWVALRPHAAQDSCDFRKTQENKLILRHYTFSFYNIFITWF